MLCAIAFTYTLLDDGSGEMGIGGNLLGLRNHKSIRMVSEYVYAKLPSCAVKATFVFRNEGPATTVTMAFPESGNYGGFVEKSDPWMKVKTHFAYFRSYVDGRRVRVSRIRKGIGFEGDTFSYENWWTKKVHFNAGEAKTVINEYRGEPGWGGAGEVEPNGSFSYVFATGSTWKDKIGSGTIQVDCRDLISKFEIDPDLTGHLKLVNGVASWSFKNLEPTKWDDVTIFWRRKKRTP